MTKIFWSLVRIRLKSLFFSGKKQNDNNKLTPKKALGKTPKIILVTVLMVYCSAVFFGMFGMLFYSLGSVLSGTDLKWFYFSLAAMISFVLCFIGSVFATQTQIYDAKDNELLLSMPVPIRFILASRMVALLVINFVYEAIVILPAVVVWAILGEYTLGAAIGTLILALLIPFLSLGLSCIVGWLIALVTSKLKRKNLFTTALSIIALVAYFAVCTNLYDYMELLINNGTQIAVAIRKSFYPAYALGLAGEGSYLMMLACTAVTALVFAAVYFVLDKTFIKISTSKTGAPKVRYKAKRLKAGKVSVALIKKEFAHFISSPMYILNAAMGVIFSVIASVFIAVSGGELVNEMTATGIPTELVELFAIMLSLAVVSFNIVSAPSISLEGKTLWLAQSLPIDPSDIMMAKVWNHFIISEAGIVLLGTSVAIFVPMSPLAKLLVLIAPTAFNMFCALFGVFVNLLVPKLNWINEAVAVKQSMSTMICMFSYMGVVALYLLPYLLWLVKYMSVVSYTLIFTILFVVASFIIYSYLTGKGKARFERLGQ